MSKEGSQSISDMVQFGANSPQARASRLLYEQSRVPKMVVRKRGPRSGPRAAKTETKSFRPTERRTERIMDVAENPALYAAERELKKAQDEKPKNEQKIASLTRRVSEEQKKQEAFLKHYAELSGAPKGTVQDKEKLEKFVAGKVGDTFETAHKKGRTFGESMILTGRVDMNAATQMATDGLGTHENLLKRAYTDRDASEFAALRKQYKTERHEDLDDMLFKNTFSELSGDDAIEIKEMMEGTPRTDKDKLSQMVARARTTQNATGPDGRNYMRNQPENKFLLQSQEKARQLILNALPPDAKPRVAFVDGKPNPAAFDKKGKFLGDGVALDRVVFDLEHGNDVYKSQLEEGEAMLTAIIQAIGAVVGIALMFVPGVNLVVAGIVTAIVTGAMTMAVKAGMRGSRYGWEEQAVDIGQTAVDAATAGLGAVGQTARVAGTASKAGSQLAKSVAREAFSGFVGSAASTAMQDEVWSDGFEKGLGKVLGAGARGAIVSGVTAGVSDGLSNKLDGALNPQVLAKATQGSTKRLGHGARRAISEVLSESAGSAAGELSGIAFDVGSGKKIDMGAAFSQMAQSVARDAITGGLRGHVMSLNMKRSRNFRRKLLTQPGPPTAQQLRQMHLYDISSGSAQYGRKERGNLAADIHAARRALADLPPSVRGAVAEMPLEGLHQIRDMIRSGEMPDLQSRRALAEMMAQGGLADVDMETFSLDLQQAIRAGHKDRADQKQVRRALFADLPNAMRRSLADLPVRDLDGLPPDALQAIGQRLAKGQPMDADFKAKMLKHLHDADPTRDRDAFFGALDRIADTAGQSRLPDDAPAAVRNAFDRLSPEMQRTVRDLVVDGVPPSRQEADALARVLGQDAPRVLDALSGADPKGSRKQQEERKQALEALGDLPPAVRAMLADLPVDTLHSLRMMQARGAADPEQTMHLLRQAVQRNPGLDGVRFMDAVQTLTTKHAGALPPPRPTDNLPRKLQRALADLPDDAAQALKALQDRGAATPAEKAALVAQALRDRPDLDGQALLRAIDRVTGGPSAGCVWRPDSRRPPPASRRRHPVGPAGSSARRAGNGGARRHL